APGGGRRQGARAVVGGLDVETLVPEQTCQADDAVDVVVDDQDAGVLPGRDGRTGRLRLHVDRTRRHWQPDGEGAAMPKPRALGGDGPTVQLGEAPDESQPDTEPPVRSFDRFLDLLEQSKNERQLLGGDPNAVILNAKDQLATLDPRRKRDPASAVRE